MSEDPELQRLFAEAPLPPDDGFSAAVIAHLEDRDRSGILVFVAATGALAAAAFALGGALEQSGASAALARAGLPVSGLAIVLMAAALPASLMARRLGSE